MPATIYYSISYKEIVFLAQELPKTGILLKKQVLEKISKPFSDGGV